MLLTLAPTHAFLQQPLKKNTGNGYFCPDKCTKEFLSMAERGHHRGFFHIHMEEGRIFSRNGRSPPHERRCQGICPMTTVNIKEVHKALGERVGRDIFMHSITLQPELETQRVLKKFVTERGIEPG